MVISDYIFLRSPSRDFRRLLLEGILHRLAFSSKVKPNASLNVPTDKTNCVSANVWVRGLQIEGLRAFSALLFVVFVIGL